MVYNIINKLTVIGKAKEIDTGERRAVDCMEEAFYKQILMNSPRAFAYHKILLDEEGRPIDYVFLEVNRAFEEMTGLKAEQIIGKTVTEVIPGIKEEEFDFIKAYAETALHGKTAEYEQYSAALGRWYHIQVYSPGLYYFAVNFLDVSRERQQVEESEKLFNRIQENELQFHRMIDNLPISLYINGIDGEIFYVNNAGKELFETGEIVTEGSSTLALWANTEDRRRFVDTLIEQGMVKGFETNLQTQKGKTFWAMVSGIFIQYQNQLCILAIQQDITQRKLMESALRASEEKYRLITEFTSDMIWIFNYTKYKFTYISPAVDQILGYQPEEALEIPLGNLLPEEFLQRVEQRTAEHVREFLENPEKSKFYIIEMQSIHKNGRLIWMETSAGYRYNAEQEIEILGVSRNIEERRNVEQKVLYLSYHDQLTGLYNRRFYEEELLRLDAARNLPVTLVLADVNGLKLTNDAFGHLAGDQLLIQVSQILSSECRGEDMVARIGGDEFVLLLPGMEEKEAEGLIANIKKTLAAKSSESSVLSVSFGCATKTADIQRMENIFVEAENAMYRHKLNESSSMRNETLKIITQVFYRKSKEEEAHNKRVGRLCGKIGRAMGMSEESVNELITAGSLHDIGKIGIEEKLFKKQNPLTETEWVEYKRHPEIGYQILKSSNEFTQIAQFVLCHHERMDGKGYPRGIKGNDIPLQARILSLADAYDRMLYPREYQEPMEEEAVIKEIAANAGSQFDEAIARIFIEKVLKRNWIDYTGA